MGRKLDHLKITLNISTHFNPGMETIKDFLVKQTELLLEELKKMDDNSTSTDDIKLPEGWEQTGSY